MMVSALARASQALDEPRYLESAQATAKFLETHLYDSKTGKLWRSYRAGGPSVDGFLDDYTDLISGLLDLYQAGFDVHWLKWAVSLQEKQDQLFGDAKEGGYFDAGSSDPSLLSRTRDSYDGAEPSPNSTAAMNLLRLAQFTDRTEWRDKAQKTLSAFAARLQSTPDALPALVSALDFDLRRRNKSSSPAISPPGTLVHCYGRSTPDFAQTKFYFSPMAEPESSNLSAGCRL
jgi:uncharacterized protein YyaL (SSP411 family)